MKLFLTFLYLLWFFSLEGLILYPRLVNVKVEKIRRKDLRKIHTNWLLRSSKTYCKRYERTVRERVLFINSVQKIKNKNHLHHACVYTLIITNTTNFCCSHQIKKSCIYILTGKRVRQQVGDLRSAIIQTCPHHWSSE